MSNQELPKITKVSEVGESLFQYIKEGEKILQGWDHMLKKTMYLFKAESGKWGYFDKETRQVLDVSQWKGKAAWLNGRWIKMTLYHRVEVFLEQPLTFNVWDKATTQNIQTTAQHVVITITDTAYKKWIEQMQGKIPGAFYKFVFSSRKLGARTITYVNDIVWVKDQEK